MTYQQLLKLHCKLLMKLTLLMLTILSLSLSNPLSAEPTMPITTILSTDTADIPPLKRNSLLLATHIEPPLAYFENDKLIGSNIEIARLLAERMNLNLRFVHCPFARCLNLLERGHVDIMVGIKKNKARQEYLSYLKQPYTTRNTPLKFYLRANNESDISSYDDLTNKSIGVLRGATYFDRFDNDNSLKKIEVTTHKQLVEMFLLGRFDTFLGREVSIQRHVPPVIYQSEMKLASYSYKKKNDSYIALSKKSPFNALQQSFSKYLELAISSSEVDKITLQYINDDSMIKTN